MRGSRLLALALALLLLPELASGQPTAGGIPASRVRVSGIATADDLQEALDEGALAVSREAADCSALTDGKAQELCRETADDSLWWCPAAAAPCSGAEWVSVGGAGGGAFSGDADGPLSGITVGPAPAIKFDAGPPYTCSGDNKTACAGNLICSNLSLGTCQATNYAAVEDSRFGWDWHSGASIAPAPDTDCAGWTGGECVCSNDPTLSCTDAGEVATCGGANRCVRSGWLANDFVMQFRWNDADGNGTGDNPDVHTLAESWEFDYASPIQSQGKSLIEKHFIANPPTALGGCPAPYNCRWETRLLDIDQTSPTMEISWTGGLDQFNVPRLFRVYKGGAYFSKNGDPSGAALGGVTYNHPNVNGAAVEGRMESGIHQTGAAVAVQADAQISLSNYRGVCDGTGGSTLGAICTTDADCAAGAGHCEKTDNLCVSTPNVMNSITPGCSAQIPEIQSTCAAGQFCVANARYTGINAGSTFGAKNLLTLDEPTTSQGTIGFCSDDEGQLCAANSDCTSPSTCTKPNDGVFSVGSAAVLNQLTMETDGGNLAPSWRGNAVSAPTSFESFHFSPLYLVQNILDLNGSGGGQGTGVHFQGLIGEQWAAVQRGTSQVCVNCILKQVNDWGILGDDGTASSDGFLMYDELDQTNPAANTTGTNGGQRAGHGLLYSLRHGMQWDDPHLRLGGNIALSAGDHLWWDETDETMRVKIDAGGEGVSQYGPRAREDGFAFVRGTGLSNRACTATDVPHDCCTGSGTGTCDTSATDRADSGPTMWAKAGVSCLSACQSTGLQCAGDDSAGAAGVGAIDYLAPDEVGCEVTTNKRLCLCE